MDYSISIDEFKNNKYFYLPIKKSNSTIEDLKPILLEVLGPDIWLKKDKQSFHDILKYSNVASLIICFFDSDEVLIRLNTTEHLTCDKNLNELSFSLVGNLYTGRPKDFSSTHYKIINLSPLSLLGIEAEKFQWEYQNT